MQTYRLSLEMHFEPGRTLVIGKVDAPDEKTALRELKRKYYLKGRGMNVSTFKAVLA